MRDTRGRDGKTGCYARMENKTLKIQIINLRCYTVVAGEPDVVSHPRRVSENEGLRMMGRECGDSRVSLRSPVGITKRIFEWIFAHFFDMPPARAARVTSRYGPLLHTVTR